MKVKSNRIKTFKDFSDCCRCYCFVCNIGSNGIRRR